MKSAFGAAPVAIRFSLFLFLSAATVAFAGPAAPPPSSGNENRSTTAPLTWDASFFDRLDLTNPALTRVQALAARKDLVGARDALCDHFRQRRVRTGFWPLDSRSPQNPDDIANHLFSFYGSEKFDAGRPIRWNDTFLGDPELTYALNRHQHFSVLASAYRKSPNPAYARAFVEQLRDWIAQNRSPDAAGRAAWRDLEVATRLGVWSDAFFTFTRAPEFSPDDQLLMLKSLYDQAAWLAPQARTAQGDWAAALATGMATVAVMFPEFKSSAAWRDEAYAALIENMKRQIYPDGSQLALSPYHHNTTLSTFWLPFRLAVENRLAVPEFYSRTLERMCAYQAYLRRPDGRYPAFNACEPADARPILTAAAAVFRRPDFLYIVNQGRSGTAPTSTSCAFLDSGVFVMRDNWTSAANYLALDGGPYGASYQHEDKLGLELAAYGQTLLVDPGHYTLDTGEPITRYLATSAAHNTVTVNGSGQRREHFPETWTPSGNPPSVWVSRPEFDYFAGRYSEGYEAAPNVRHLRRVFFLKDTGRPYWIISDRLVAGARPAGPTSPSAAADRTYLISSRWQFVPGNIEPRPGLTYATRLARGNLAICPPADVASSWTARVLTGSRDPMGGWASFAYGKVVAAPQLGYDLRTSLPATLDYAFIPFRGPATPPVVRTYAASAATGADFTALDLDFGEFRDTIFVAHDLKKAERDIAGCPTKGCFVVIRTARGGKPAVVLDGGL